MWESWKEFGHVPWGLYTLRVWEAQEGLRKGFLLHLHIWAGTRGPKNFQIKPGLLIYYTVQTVKIKNRIYIISSSLV